MTVEQLGVRCEQPEKIGNEVYTKIQEVTGICDQNQIDRAITACRDKSGKYAMDDVINMLLENAIPGFTQSGPVVAVSSVSKAVETVDITDISEDKTNSKGMTIDLTTSNENEDIQRAVEESLKNQQGILGGQVTREDEEISKVIEQSIAEDSKLGMKRKRGELWFIDPLNPHERKRENDWPVGLKNVGNTCWFSAVIQSLFHLPVFRQHVLNFVTPSDPSTREGTDRHRNLMFMHELRCLFALMVASHRKYVDPSKAVEILKEAFTSGTSVSGSSDSQQDVSEFQHKLLEWLEDAFKMLETGSDLSSSSADGNAGKEPNNRTSNPMVQLFYGQYLAEGINEGNHFSNKEMFGQFPLQVDGFKDIHESLEAATAQGEIETLSDDTTTKSGQELWFTRLPPVLTFELSRFQFNTKLSRPEKIHKKLDFPERIFMDRYLECNRSITRRKREDAKKLKEELCKLQNRLDKYVNYGSGSKRFPLQDILQCVLEYAESHESVGGFPKPEAGSPDACHGANIISDVEMDSPKSRSCVSAMESPMLSPLKLDVDPGQTDILPVSPLPTAMEIEESSPYPRNVSKEELEILQSCLQRWRSEVEEEVRDLQDKISKRECQINALYADEDLMKCPYRLHAVLVHEGQAVSGHYWAYVFSTKYQKWLKFNDISATEASWDEIQKDGFGGFHNTSAYCVMYVNQDLPDLLAEKIGQGDELNPDSLVPDLLQFVHEDNEKFQNEIQVWDLEQQRKNQSTGAEQGCMDVDIKPQYASQAAAQQTVVTSGRKRNLSLLHALISSQETLQMLSQIYAADQFSRRTSEEILDMAFKDQVKQEWDLTESLSSYIRNDCRVKDVFNYFLVNGASEDVLRLTLVENVCHVLTTIPSSNPNSGSLNKTSGKIRETLKAKPGVFELQQDWHQKYKCFREVVFAFVSGVRAYHNQRFSEALPCFAAAYILNDKLIENGRSPNLGLQATILAYYRRQSIVNFSEISVRAFHSDECVDDLCIDMLKLFLPCFTTLLSSRLEKDTQTIEHVRSRWCELLNNDYADKKRDTLQELLAALLDDSKEMTSPVGQVPQLRDDPLVKDFEAAFDLASIHGCIEAAAKDV